MSEKPIKLHSEPVKQQAWWLQVNESAPESNRHIDKLSIRQIFEMYEKNQFICDDCGGKFNVAGKLEFTILQHILHILNTDLHWSCEDCIMKDIKSGCVIGSTEEIANHTSGD